MCARTEWFLREFRRAMASPDNFPTDHLLSGPPLFGTLSAHGPGHDIAKPAVRRHGLADAGSVFDISEFHVIPTLSLATTAIRYVHSTTPVFEWLMPDRLERSAFAFHPLKGSVPGEREHDQ